MKVLVVDDSRALRNHLRRMPTSIGAYCIDGGDGQEAVEKVDSGGPFNLALVDHDMLRLDGPGFLDVLQDDGNAANMEKPMVTSMADHVFVVRTLARGQRTI